MHDPDEERCEQMKHVKPVGATGLYETDDDGVDHELVRKDELPPPALEMNEVGDMLPGCVMPFPQLCAYPDCEKIPIVGVNKRFVCEDHLKWVLKPMRDIVRLVEKMT